MMLGLMSGMSLGLLFRDPKILKTDHLLILPALYGGYVFLRHICNRARRKSEQTDTYYGRPRDVPFMGLRTHLLLYLCGGSFTLTFLSGFAIIASVY
jgi:hypothetical protein